MTPVPVAASTLLAGLLSTSRPLVEVARTRTSVHYETGDSRLPVLCVSTPAAVRLPCSLLSPVLPRGPVTTASFAVRRWWTPPRPRSDARPTGPIDLDPHRLIGCGPGLTPAGDDVLAGALVAAAAVRHPDLHRLASGVRAALRARRTTVVSVGLLHAALDGWATPELAAFVEAPGPATEAALLTLGHSSGAALRDGAAHVLRGAPALLEGAA